MCPLPLTIHAKLPNTDQLANEIATDGFIIVDNFLSAASIAELALEAIQLAAGGQMHEANTGQGSTSSANIKSINNKLRGDSVYWINTNEPSTALQTYLTALQAVQNTLNQYLFLGLFELESHFAIYPIGSRYHKHVDQFQHDQSRKVSCVLYLNQGWNEDDGGALRMYLDATEDTKYMDIAPHAGRLVLFLSEQFPHEVLPANRERISITGWFRTRSTSLPT
jgi:SM-20-related protein